MHATISDYLLDIIQNSLEADATEIYVEIEETSNEFLCMVKDNGHGMDEETLRNAIDPFFSSGKKHRRKQGLGLSFLAQTVEATEGKFSINSKVGEGTIVSFSLNTQHIDCPPLGNLADTFLSAMLFPGDYELKIERKKKTNSYSLSRKELLAQLGELETLESIALARDYIKSLES